MKLHTFSYLVNTDNDQGPSSVLNKLTGFLNMQMDSQKVVIWWKGELFPSSHLWIKIWTVVNEGGFLIAYVVTCLRGLLKVPVILYVWGHTA